MKTDVAVLRMTEPVTQKDIAERLKISQGTVSRALHGRRGVNHRVRQMVLAAARAGGYELPDAEDGARQSVICVDIPHGDQWHERLISGVIEAAKEIGSEVIITPHMLNQLPQVVMRKQVDGLIRLMSQSDYSCGRNPAVSPVPTVSVLYPVPGADVVSVDHFGSSRALALQLVKRVAPACAAYVGLHEPIGLARYYGFRCGLEESGVTLPPELVRLTHTLDAAQTMPLVDELLARRAAGRPEHQFTLIAFYNDFLARHAVPVIRRRGLRVPEDIGVAGYDDVDMPVEADLKLTTVHLPLEELGAAAVRRLHGRLNNPDDPPLHWLLDTRIVDGNSVAAKTK